MVVAEVTNDTIEIKSPRKRGSGSVDVIPEDDGLSPKTTTERPMEDSTRAEPPTRTDSGSAIALVKRAARRASSALLSLKSTSSRDLFFSKSNTGPSWLRKLSAARRSADSRESIDEQSMSSKSAKGVPRDALDRADAATSFRPLPREVLDDGFKVPNFDVTRLQDIGERPTGRGCQAYIWRCVVPEGKKAGQICALKVIRESQARSPRDRETLVREAHFLCRMRSPHVLRSLGVSETVDKLPCLLRESVRNLPAAFGD